MWHARSIQPASVLLFRCFFPFLLILLFPPLFPSNPDDIQFNHPNCHGKDALSVSQPLRLWDMTSWWWMTGDSIGRRWRGEGGGNVRVEQALLVSSQRSSWSYKCITNTSCNMSMRTRRNNWSKLALTHLLQCITIGASRNENFILTTTVWWSYTWYRPLHLYQHSLRSGYHMPVVLEPEKEPSVV
jgi:hypothetical protein